MGVVPRARPGAAAPRAGSRRAAGTPQRAPVPDPADAGSSDRAA
ncbi:MAG: hypothetical protein ACRDP7_17635 [Trebonia sp.]